MLPGFCLQVLGPKPAYYALWPAGQLAAPWRGLADALYAEVAFRSHDRFSFFFLGPTKHTKLPTGFCATIVESFKTHGLCATSSQQLAAT